MHDDFEDGWPCQRIRLAVGALAFFAIEKTLGPTLPAVMLYLVLGLALACAASAVLAVRAWRLEAQLFVLQEALATHRHPARRARR